MSFFLTTQQFIDNTKDVTRRLGWANLKPGEHFMAVEKAQGLKKGEKIRKLGECVCVSNEREQLRTIMVLPFKREMEETRREGFPKFIGEDFVKMFCREMKCTPNTIVNRIEFKRVEP